MAHMERLCGSSQLRRLLEGARGRTLPQIDAGGHRGAGRGVRRARPGPLSGGSVPGTGAGAAMPRNAAGEIRPASPELHRARTMESRRLGRLREKSGQRQFWQLDGALLSLADSGAMVCVLSQGQQEIQPGGSDDLSKWHQ